MQKKKIGVHLYKSVENKQTTQKKKIVVLNLLKTNKQTMQNIKEACSCCSQKKKKIVVHLYKSVENKQTNKQTNNSKEEDFCSPL